jgi:hypothetical protein
MFNKYVPVYMYIYPHSVGVWILQQYILNEEKPPCRTSPVPAEPPQRIPLGVVGRSRIWRRAPAFTPFRHVHILFNIARSRVQTASSPCVRHNTYLCVIMNTSQLFLIPVQKMLQHVRPLSCNTPVMQPSNFTDLICYLIPYR